MGRRYVEGLERLLDPDGAPIARGGPLLRRTARPHLPRALRLGLRLQVRAPSRRSRRPEVSRLRDRGRARPRRPGRGRGHRADARAPARGRPRRASTRSPEVDASDKPRTARKLRRGDRRLHGLEGADAALGPADAVRPAEPGGLGHAHRRARRSSVTSPGSTSRRRSSTSKSSTGSTTSSRFLGGRGGRGREDSSARTSFSRYQSFFQDKQNVLAYEDEQLQDYLALTERRSLRRLRDRSSARTRSCSSGAARSSGDSRALAILSAVGVVDWQLPAITGGLGLAQLSRRLLLPADRATCSGT